MGAAIKRNRTGKSDKGRARECGKRFLGDGAERGDRALEIDAPAVGQASHAIIAHHEGKLRGAHGARRHGQVDRIQTGG